jgi:hypothetical protein
MNTHPKETIVDNLYRYVLEYDGYGVQQDFPTKQDIDLLEKKFMIEIQKEKERKKDEIRSV